MTDSTSQDGLALGDDAGLRQWHHRDIVAARVHSLKPDGRWCECGAAVNLQGRTIACTREGRVLVEPVPEPDGSPVDDLDRLEVRADG